MLRPPPLPGGLGVTPVITSLEQTQGMLTAEWLGLQGPYQLVYRTTPATSRLRNLGPATDGSRMTVPYSGDPDLVGVTAVASAHRVPYYVGAESCWLCHIQSPDHWNETAHGRAFESLKRVNQQSNPACLVCHTVGFGTAAGFTSESVTPHLAGVQCESCHGPAGPHLANVRDPSVRPKVTMAAEVCGGCHNFHHPTYTEWEQSAHSQASASASGSIRRLGERGIRSCGACHSGAARVALLKQLQEPSTPLPGVDDAAFFGVTCAVCHDPHATIAASPAPEMLRNPLFSTKPFSFDPSPDIPFAAQYDPGVQLCAQCHNMRGAQWQDTDQSPHPSAQYNLLIGQGAFDLGRPIESGHAEIDHQCVHCHRGPTSGSGSIAETFVGHRFEVQLESCVICHISTTGVGRALARTQTGIRNTIQEIKGLLDNWAGSKAPGGLQRYGALAWEYTVPGSISNPNRDPNLRGPAAIEQSQIPDAIKQARFNLYLVESDGSFGAHNGFYSRHLLNVARQRVQAELSQ